MSLGLRARAEANGAAVGGTGGGTKAWGGLGWGMPWEKRLGWSIGYEGPRQATEPAAAAVLASAS